MTLVDERAMPGYTPSSLTTVPAWQSPSTGLTGSARDRYPRQPGARREPVVLHVAGPRPDWFGTRLAEELTKLLVLPPGWDGGTADRVTAEAAVEAVRVLASVASVDTIVPQLFPLADGGVQIEWHVDGNDIEIEIDGSGRVYVLATRSTGDTVVDDVLDAPGHDHVRRRTADFLNELSARPDLAHLSCDIRNSISGAVLRRR
ncbi:MAG: hypothetical protein J2P26_09985 [Nocardiopsaceae bacterium]|nr:hypothetical protein [Nocardiopsaceae bacterium]